jgi:hypothetical protein
MAEQLYLYCNNSDPKKAYKSLTNGHSYSGGSFSFKDPTDVLNPVLQISKASVGDDWQILNYAYIPKFGNRKYFMSFKADRGEILEYDLHVDVLSTYADKLLTQKFELERAETNKASSLKFADAERPLQADKWVGYFLIGALDETTGGTYTLTVAGGAAGA